MKTVLLAAFLMLFPLGKALPHPDSLSTPQPPVRSQMVRPPSGKLAKALLRLQGGSQQRPSRVRYRLITFLGGKLAARVSS